LSEQYELGKLQIRDPGSSTRPVVCKTGAKAAEMRGQAPDAWEC